MIPFFCEATATSPRVLLDKAKGIFEISGRSLPENTLQFYEPILAWVENYSAHPNTETCLEMNLEYYNSGSNMILYKLLRMLQALPGLEVIWAYHPDDEEILEAGQELSRDTKVAFLYRVHAG